MNVRRAGFRLRTMFFATVRCSRHAVFENRENGVLRYELFIQNETERGTPHSTPYIFSNGRVTVIPGYGRILRVESIEGGVDDINYQVVTENGIIKGAP